MLHGKASICFKKFQEIFMTLLKDILPGIRAAHGTQVDVAKKIGIKSQLLGQYENGKRNPKVNFYNKWKDVFGEDLQAMIREANVSHETKNHTQVDKRSDNKENSPKGDSEIYRTIVEGKTEYVLVKRSILKDAQIVSNIQLDATINNMNAIIRKMDNDSQIMNILVTKFVDTVERVMSRPEPAQAQKSKNNH